MTTTRTRGLVLGVALVLFPTFQGAVHGQHSTGATTQIALLGTGTPLPDPGRAGPSVAIVTNGTAYVVDVGVGMVRREFRIFYDITGQEVQIVAIVSKAEAEAWLSEYGTRDT